MPLYNKLTNYPQELLVAGYENLLLGEILAIGEKR